MFARIVAVASLLLVGSLLVPGLSQAAGSSGWAGGYHQVKRPQFRPWHGRASVQQPQARWRPHPRTATFSSRIPRYHAAAGRPALIEPDLRQNAPVSRAFARSATAGVRFRPSGRQGAGQIADDQPIPRVLAPDPRRYTQFRPDSRERLTYEQLQANASSKAPVWSPYELAAGTRPAGNRRAVPRPGSWRAW